MIMLCLLAMASCEKEIEIKKSGRECDLSVNAALLAGVPDQAVYIAKSFHDRVRGIKEAHLDCYVNDELMASSDSLVPASAYPGYNYDGVMKIPFRVSFDSGDNVRIEVTGDGLAAYAENVAPRPAKITSVDTIPMLKISNGKKHTVTKLKIKLRDVPNIRNYYRIELFVRYSITQIYLAPDEYDSVGLQFLRKGILNISVDNRAEPILYTGNHFGANPNYDQDDVDYYENKYNLFTDKDFENGEYEMTLLSRDFRQIYDFLGIAFLPTVRVSEKRTLVIRLYTMDKDMYSYYNDMMYDNSWQGREDYVPSIPYPENVHGGNGFVGALGVSDYEIELPYIEDLYKHHHSN